MTEQELEERLRAAVVAYCLEHGEQTANLSLAMAHNLWVVAKRVWNGRVCEWEGMPIECDITLEPWTVRVSKQLNFNAKMWESVLKQTYMPAIRQVLDSSRELLEYMEKDCHGQATYQDSSSA